MRTFKLVTLMTLGFLIVSCCACRNASKNAAPLSETKWKMVEYMSKTVPTDQDNYYFILNSKESAINGRGDCNSIMGKYKLEGTNEIDIEMLASTRAMCPNQQMEDDFMKMLQEVDTYKIDGNMLILMDDNKVIAIFESQGIPTDKLAK